MVRPCKGSVYFDMDGTIADLYGVPDWLPKLRAGDPSPYVEAAPLVDPVEFIELLEKLRAAGYRIGIVSWLSKDSNRQYDRAVRGGKTLWLHNVLRHFVFDEIHFIKYGRAKHSVVKDKSGWIFDDSDEVLKKWKGKKIDVKTKDIMHELERLL